MRSEHLAGLQESNHARVKLEAETVAYVVDCSGGNVQAKRVTRGSGSSKCGLSRRGEPQPCRPAFLVPRGTAPGLSQRLFTNTG